MYKNLSIATSKIKSIRLLDFLTEYNNLRLTKRHSESLTSLSLKKISKTISNSSSRQKMIIKHNRTNSVVRGNGRGSFIKSIEDSKNMSHQIDTIRSSTCTPSIKKLQEKRDKLEDEVNSLDKIKKELIVKRMTSVENQRHVESVLNDIKKYIAITKTCKENYLELSLQINMLKREFQRIDNDESKNPELA